MTQDDIMEITDTLAEDGRFKALDRLDADRKLLLFQVMKMTPETQSNINVECVEKSDCIGPDVTLRMLLL